MVVPYVHKITHKLRGTLFKEDNGAFRDPVKNINVGSFSEILK